MNARYKRSPTKYGSKASGGYASRREHRRADELRLLEKMGEITELREQVKYELVPKQEGERAVTYTVDFTYRDKAGEFVAEDAKGFRTQQYVIRRKLMLWRHGIRVREV